MAVISTQQKQTGTISSGQTVASENQKEFTDEQAEQIAMQVAAKLNTHVADEESSLYYGDTSSVSKARSVNMGEVAGQVIEQGREAGYEPDVVTAMLHNTIAKREIMQQDDDYTAMELDVAVDPNASPEFVRGERRLAWAVADLTRMADERSPGVFGTIKDLVGHVTFDMPGYVIRKGIGENEEFGRQVALAAEQMDDTEWREYYHNVVVPHFESVGAFGDNWFTQMDMITQLDRRGFNSSQGLEFAAGVFDIATIVSPTKIVGATKAAGRRALSRAKPVTRVGNEGGVAAANDAAEALARNGAESRPAYVEDTIPDSYSTTRNADEVRASQARRERVFEESKVLDQARKNNEIVAGASAADLSRLAKDKAAEVVATVGRPLYSARLVANGVDPVTYKDVGIGNYIASTLVGRADDGLPLSQSQANKIAKGYRDEKGLDATAVQADPYDAKKGFLVQINEPLNVSNLASPYDVEEALSDHIFGILPRSMTNWVASARTSAPAAASKKSLSGEGLKSNLLNADKDRVGIFNKLTGKELNRVNKAVEYQRDGVMANKYSDTWMSPNEFASWYRDQYGKVPSQKVVDAYLEMIEMSDEAYFMAASNLLSDFNNRGFKAVHVGISGRKHVPARPVSKSELTGKDQVWDASKGAFVNDPVRDIRDDWVIWKTEEPMVDPNGGRNMYFNYVIRPKNGGVRTLLPEDVLQYNAGGHRVYDPNYSSNFVVLDGNQAGGQAIMTAPNRAFAKKAAEEFQEIIALARSKGAKSWNDAVGDAELDALANKMTALKEVTDYASLQKIANKRGWRFASNVSHKASGDIIEDISGTTTRGGQTYQEFVSRSNTRGQDPLMAFGGEEARLYSPIEAIQKQLHNQSTELAFRGATVRQMSDWLKTADPKWKPEPGVSTQQAFLNYDMKLLGDGRVAQYLKAQRATIERRLGRGGPIIKAMENAYSSTVNGIADARGFTGAKNVNAAAGLLQTENVLRVNFLSAFAFNVSQLVVQASWAPFIFAISPKAGMRGIMSTLPVRLAMHTPWPSIDKPLLSKMMQSVGVKGDVFDGLVEFTKKRGNYNVDGEAIEKGADVGKSIEATSGKGALSEINLAGKRALQKAERIGMKFFNEGERANRLTANNTAVFEWLDANPTKSIRDLLNDTDAFEAVALRADDLALNMTTTSRAPIQTGVARIPGQWLGFTMKVVEVLTYGKQLGGAEKARLWTAILAVGGLGNMIPGGKSAADWLAERGGFEGGGFVHTALRNGLIDAILEEAWEGATGQSFKTAIGDRISPLGGAWELARRVKEDTLLETAFGPTGSIAGGALSSLAEIGAAVYTGNTTLAVDSLERFYRTPAAINNAVNAYGILRNGVYTSKNGREMTGMELSYGETAMVGLGLGSGKRNDAAWLEQRNRNRAKEKGAISRKVSDMRRDLWRAYSEGDREKAIRISQDINTLIKTSGLSHKDMSDIRWNAEQQDSDIIYPLMREAIRQDNNTDFERQQIRNLGRSTR